MNCKPGDLVIVVKGKHGVGTVLKCISLIGFFKPNETFIHPRTQKMVFSYSGGYVWDIESDKFSCASDSVLIPIRDNDGEDETLTWAGKPVKETA